nr:MAG TPA: Chagasin family peptidase inhibitor [Bacteriophage sp.]
MLAKFTVNPTIGYVWTVDKCPPNEEKRELLVEYLPA